MGGWESARHLFLQALSHALPYDINKYVDSWLFELDSQLQRN